MNHAFILAAMITAIAGTAQAASMVKSTLVECTPAACGGLPDTSDARLAMMAGSVAVAPDGRVTVSISGLRDRASGQSRPLKVIELYFGTMLDTEVRTIRLGTVVTDGEGNFKGQITSEDGRLYKFRRGLSHVGQFYLHDPAASKTEFVTGFSVWR